MYAQSRIRSLIGVIFVVALVMALTAIVGAQEDTRGILRALKGSSSAASNLDPMTNMEGPTKQFVNGQLTRSDMGATFVVPALAESWESDETGQVWDFPPPPGANLS